MTLLASYWSSYKLSSLFLASYWSPTALKRPDRSKQCHCLQFAKCIAGLLHYYTFMTLYSSFLVGLNFHFKLVYRKRRKLQLVIGIM